MTTEKENNGPTLAEALDATQWDFVPDPERKMLLRPVGSIFENLPWEADPQYLGPVPLDTGEIEDRSGGVAAPKNPDDEP